MVLEHVPSADLICEPVGRNTAPSIGIAAMYLAKKDPKAVMVVLPADHAVKDEAKLRAVISEAVGIAQRNEVLVTIGITPLFPHTGYGYIKRGTAIEGNAYTVGRFYEKPNFERAKKYVDSLDYYWNSGMFVWRADVILAAIEEFMPELHRELKIFEKAIGTNQEEKVLADVFSRIEGNSIDFGILEHARNCVVVAANGLGWNDVGSWDAWAEHFSTDTEGNLVHGDAILIDSQKSVVYSKDRLIAVLGCEDLIIIDAKDALLVCPRSRVQDVKKIVDELKRRGRADLI
jgi:mannose-1-phosphate guanylyltransferase